MPTSPASVIRPVHLSLADIGPLEEEYVLAALRSGWVTGMGPDVDAFEAEMAGRIGVEHAVALSSGTAALHLALIALGAGPGTAVIVPTLTFAATANAVAYTGARPVLVDCNEDGNVDARLVERALRSLREEGVPVAAVMSVDLFGRSADYNTLEPLLTQWGVPLLEDAAEALGAVRGGRAAGSYGAAAALSFNGNKIMTTSGGGMFLSEDPLLAARARKLASQAREPVPWYEHEETGYNYRLSNVLAALGRAQLSRLDSLIARRRAVRARYEEALDGLGLRFLGRSDDPGDNCWLTVVVLNESSPSGDSVVAALNERSIEARHVWKPMHRQPVFAGCLSVLSGVSDELFARGVALPSGSTLTVDDVSRVIDGLSEVLT